MRPAFATAGMLWEGHWTGGHKWWWNLGSYKKWGKQSSTKKEQFFGINKWQTLQNDLWTLRSRSIGFLTVKWCGRTAMYWHALQCLSHANPFTNMDYLEYKHWQKQSQTRRTFHYQFNNKRQLTIFRYKQLNRSAWAVGMFLSILHVFVLSKTRGTYFFSRFYVKPRGQVSLNEFIKWYAETWAARVLLASSFLNGKTWRVFWRGNTSWNELGR